MTRLVLADLLAGVRIWAGLAAVLAAVLVAAGLAGTVPAVLVRAGLDASGTAALGAWSLAGTAAVLSLVAVLVVTTSTLRLAVTVRTRTFALWQVVGVLPRTAARIVLVEVLLVAFVGAVLGVLLGAAVAPGFVAYGLRGTSGLEALTPRLAGADLLVVAVVTSALVVLAAVGPSRRVAGTPPIAALRDPDVVDHRRRVLPLLVAGGLAAVAVGMLSTLSSTVDTGANQLLLIGVVVVAVAAALAPQLTRPVLRAWTALPARWWPSLFLARAAALQGLGRTAAGVSAVVVAAGLPAALLAGAHTSAALSGGGSSGSAGAAIALLIGGPVLLASIGAAAGVLISARDRSREQALLRAAGAGPAQTAGIAMLETTLVAVTGLLLAGVAVVLTSALELLVLAATGHRVPFDAGLPALLVAAVLVAALMAVATAVPALVDLRRPVRAVLSAE
ncbi:hypothetical protein GCM10022197_11810 [Microlunatus spumicola]|uniref:ABC3 transporter permease C-terminal domain-containing protein n=1 Tax=Microlunatus spumicola TaxID=81499 RepID=A0ABP6WZL9_9ACTN